MFDFYITVSISSLATPQFVDAPQDVTATEGDNAELQCRATGRPSPTISWTHNSAPIAQNIRARQGDSGSLTIINVRVSDAGLYECRASSSDQTITSSARLRVLGNSSNTPFLEKNKIIGSGEKLG